MSIKKIGITGETGFIGGHIKRNLNLYSEKYQVVPFQKHFLSEKEKLGKWVSECDVIIHLAALNRHSNPQIIYDDNINLVKKLISAVNSAQVKPHIIFSSSTQEANANVYGNSKREGREMLELWGRENEALVNALLIPNVFGPFGKPFYNSFIATFCHQLVNNEHPTITSDGHVKLIYVQELADLVLQAIENKKSGQIEVHATHEARVSEILSLLESYRDNYLLKGNIPSLTSNFELALFNTFRSYINHDAYFPVKLKQNIDNRGAFVEVIRLGIGGQVSFSTTVPGITRGNHYHTRKIERFAVIKGKALIRLRKVDEETVSDFYLNGDEPAYVDMPIWHTHNIKNIGEEELLTIFWINEPYDVQNPDTYFVEV